MNFCFLFRGVLVLFWKQKLWYSFFFLREGKKQSTTLSEKFKNPNALALLFQKKELGGKRIETT
jgi:hypothetical protein